MPIKIQALIEIDSRSWSHPAPVVPQWARDLRAAGLRTAILSNMPVTVRDLYAALLLAARVRFANVFLRSRRMQAPA